MNIQMNEFHGIGICDTMWFQVVVIHVFNDVLFWGAILYPLKVTPTF
jgi:hypothetical protein